jgi:hypothetical protein
MLAILLIIGWVSLSGFDVVEDLDDISSQIVLSSSSPNDSSNAKVRGWGPLANNIIESANRIQQGYGTLVTFSAIIFNLNAFSDFRRHFPLHKLYRVFLI